MTHKTFFKVDGDIVLLPEAEICPAIDQLVLVGFAIDHEHLVHAIFELRGTRETHHFYVGPNEFTVARRAKVVAFGLAAAGVHPVAVAYCRRWIVGRWGKITSMVARVRSEKLMQELEASTGTDGEKA